MESFQMIESSYKYYLWLKDKKRWGAYAEEAATKVGRRKRMTGRPLRYNP